MSEKTLDPEGMGEPEPLSEAYYRRLVRWASQQALLLIPQTVFRWLQERGEAGFPDDRQLILLVDLRHLGVVIPDLVYGRILLAWQAAAPADTKPTKLVMRVHQGGYRDLTCSPDGFWISVHMLDADSWDRVYVPWAALVEFFDTGAAWTLRLQMSEEEERLAEEIVGAGLGAGPQDSLTEDAALRSLLALDPKKTLLH